MPNDPSKLGFEYRLPANQPSAPEFSTFAPSIIGRITSSSQDGPNRWVYGFVEVEKTKPGYGGWTPVDGGVEDVVRNLIEDMNSDTPGSYLGNGLPVNSLVTDTATFELLPIPVGAIVMIAIVSLPDEESEEEGEAETVEYWCQYENAVDGGCDE